MIRLSGTVCFDNVHSNNCETLTALVMETRSAILQHVKVFALNLCASVSTWESVQETWLLSVVSLTK